MRRLWATSFLLASLGPAWTAEATPFVPDFSNGPVVFDFEDGTTQGWAVGNEVFLVRADDIFAEGPNLALMGLDFSFMTMEIDLTQVAAITWDEFDATRPPGQRIEFNQIAFLFVQPGESPPFDVLGGQSFGGGINPTKRACDVSNLVGPQRIQVTWENRLQGADPGFLDNITLIPIPEPSTLLLLVLGGLGVGAVFSRRRRRLKAILLVGGSLAWSPSAEAVTITFGFLGEVVSVSLPSGIVLPRTFGGSFIFDPSISDSDPDPEQGSYRELLHEVRLEFDQLVLVLEPTASAIEVRTGTRMDYFVALEGFTNIGGERERVGFLLDLRLPRDPEAPPVFESDALPLVPPPIRGGEISLAVSGHIGLFADVTDVFLIPEPITALLLAIGLAGLAWSRRRASP